MMRTFILLSFVFLGFVFYEMSGGMSSNRQSGWFWLKKRLMKRWILLKLLWKRQWRWQKPHQSLQHLQRTKRLREERQ